MYLLLMQNESQNEHQSKCMFIDSLRLSATKFHIYIWVFQCLLESFHQLIFYYILVYLQYHIIITPNNACRV